MNHWSDVHINIVTTTDLMGGMRNNHGRIDTETENEAAKELILCNPIPYVPATS